jgi:hypothetical protein
LRRLWFQAQHGRGRGNQRGQRAAHLASTRTETAVPARLPDVVFVKGFEAQAEASLKLFLPLEQHGGRAGDDDFASLFAEQQLASNKPGLDGCAEAHVVGDKQVHTREAVRLSQGLELVRVEPEAGAKKRLKQEGAG